MNKIKRQIIIRIQSNQVMYTFESELDALKKLADGHRHQVQRRLTPLTLGSNGFFSSLVLLHTTSRSRNDYQVQRFVILLIRILNRWEKGRSLDPAGRTILQPNLHQDESRYAERRQQVYKHFGHEFVTKIFKLPKFCSVCSDMLWFVSTPCRMSPLICSHVSAGGSHFKAFNANDAIVLSIEAVTVDSRVHAKEKSILM